MKTEKCTNDPDLQTSKKPFIPPDGGCRAWLVMICSFLCNGVIFGIHNSSGSIFVFLKEKYGGDSSMASLVGSLGMGATFGLSAISSLLADKYGIRKTATVGAILAFLGMLLSAFAVDHLELLCVTYGLMFGGGASLVYSPSLVILGHYFKKHMGVVNGFVATGSCIFTVAMPHILKALLEGCGLKYTFLFLAALMIILIIAALSFKPLMPSTLDDNENQDQQGCCAEFKRLFNVENWKNKKYFIWSMAFPMCLFGYFVFYVHIVQFVKDKLPNQDGNYLVTCVAITSGVGRIIFGKIADLPNVNRIFLQQISFVSIGICTMLLTAAPYFTGFEFPAMIICALIMGLFDGCFITVLGPIAFDICGPSGASQAIGFLLTILSVPLTLGPPIAGFLKDWLQDYTVSFILAGIPPIIGAFFMCLIHKIKLEDPQSNPVQVESNPQGMISSVTVTTQLSTNMEEKAHESESLLVKNDHNHEKVEE